MDSRTSSLEVAFWNRIRLPHRISFGKQKPLIQLKNKRRQHAGIARKPMRHADEDSSLKQVPKQNRTDRSKFSRFCLD